jgi:hypothetical protein
MSCFLNVTFSPQVIIQGVNHVRLVQIKKNVDTGRLYVGIHNANPETLLGKQGRQIRSGIGFPRSTAE